MLWRNEPNTLGTAIRASVAAILSVTPVTRVEAQGDNREANRAGSEAISRWNAIALEVTGTGPFSPPREARAMAIVSAAVFDAVMSITGDYDPYIIRAPASHDASIEAAVAAAAHDVLVSLYPQAERALTALRDSALSTVANKRSREDGVQVGRVVAVAALTKRAGDRASEVATYAASSHHGAWAPTPPAFVAALEPAWGRVRPFLLDSGSQFRPGPPPSLDSEIYRRDYEEIIAIGSSSSTTRTREQADAGQFWVATAAQCWNQVVRQLSAAKALSPSAAARAFLLLNLAGADAMVAAWDAKYTYNQWRPVTAIRFRGANPIGQSDSLWSPLIVTPPFPDYPAGHTAYAGAAERVLTAVFGDSPGMVSIRSLAAPHVTREYRSFAEIAEEVTNARVWAGVHWRTSSTVGRTLGRAVGDWALARAPGPVR